MAEFSGWQCAVSKCRLSTSLMPSATAFTSSRAVAGLRSPPISQNQVIEAGIAIAGILPPGAALRGTVGERLFDPAFIGADVAQVDRREEDLNALLAGFTDDPVGVFEVRLVGRREIAGNQERRLPVAVDRAMEFMLDEIDDDGIEALAAAVFQVQLRFVFGETGNQRPGCVALDQKWLPALVDHVTVAGSDADGVRAGGEGNRRDGQTRRTRSKLGLSYRLPAR